MAGSVAFGEGACGCGCGKGGISSEDAKGFQQGLNYLRLARWRDTGLDMALHDFSNLLELRAARQRAGGVLARLTKLHTYSTALDAWRGMFEAGPCSPERMREISRFKAVGGSDLLMQIGREFDVSSFASNDRAGTIDAAGKVEAARAKAREAWDLIVAEIAELDGWVARNLPDLERLVQAVGTAGWSDLLHPAPIQSPPERRAALVTQHQA